MFGRSNDPQEITISNRTLLRVVLIIFSAIILVRLFESLIHPLTLILVSFILALAINPSVSWIAKRLKNKSRVRATAISYLSVMTIIIAFFALILPPLINQTRDFINDAPQTIEDLKEDEGAVGELVRKYELEEQVSSIADDWASGIATFEGPVVSTANRVVSNLISIITVLILTFMMLIEGEKWMNMIYAQLPKNRKEHTTKLASGMAGVITNYVNRQFLIAAIGSIFAIVALFIATSIFNIDTINPVALGGIVFLFNLIPTIGVFISTAVVVLFSAFVSLPLAITMLVFFIIYQQIENATIQPYIQAKGLELTPLTVFISVILGVSIAGVVGAFIAIPIVGCLKVLLDDFIDRKKTEQNKAKKASG